MLESIKYSIKCKTLEDVKDVKLENLNDDAANLLYSALLLPEVLDAF